MILFDLHGEYLKAFSDEGGRPLSNVARLSGQDLVLRRLRREAAESLDLTNVYTAGLGRG